MEREGKIERDGKMVSEGGREGKSESKREVRDTQRERYREIKSVRVASVANISSKFFLTLYTTPRR